MKKLIIFLGVFLFGYFNDRLYDLMYKSFIYNKDLTNAYEVANKALKYEKNSLKWRKRVADVSLWLGKTQEAYKNYMFIFKKTHNKKIEKILFQFSYPFKELLKLKTKVYLKEFKRGDFSNTVKLANIYYSLGEIQKAENILKKAYEKTKDKNFFDLYVKYALLSEDIDVFKKNINILRNESLKDKIKIAYILININDFKDAYDLLIYVRKIPEDEQYYKVVIYVTYELKKFNELVRLLNYMYNNNLMTKSSFSLFLNYYYSVYDYQKLEELLKYAIKKFHYNVYKDYVNVLISNHKYKKALKVLEEYKKKFNQKEYFKLKAYIFYKLKNYKEATEFYTKLLNFDLNKDELNEILWFSINTENYKLFNKIKNKIENHYMLALAYLTFFKVDKAYYEMLNVKFDSLDKYLTFINILEIEGKDSFKYKIKAFNFANFLLKENPKLLKDPSFLKNYINLAIYFLLPEKINFLLKTAKKVLNKQDYLDVKIAYYFKLNEYDKLFYIKNYNKDFK